MKIFLPRRPKMANVSRKRASSSTDPFATIKAIGTMAFLVDSIAGVTGNGTNVTSITDQSGSGATFAITTAPLFTATKWGGILPAMQFARANVHRLIGSIALAIPQPYTLFAVLDGYTFEGGLGAGANMNLINGGGISYSIAKGSENLCRWSLFAGTAPQDSSLDRIAGQGKCLRVDVFNGASSLVYRGNTVSSALAGTPGASAFTTSFGIGAATGATDPMTGILAAFGCYTKALSAAEIATLTTFFANRYTGMATT